MGGIEPEFARELASWRRRHAGDPHGEMQRLLLLALEREEIVGVSYREELLARRIGRLRMDEDARDVIRHALRWTWRDEEMHAIWLRGILLSQRRAWTCAKAYAQQASGAIGGWAASVKQHVPFGDAPVSVTLATVATAAGRIAGKVPREVRPYLTERPFRDFCAFNVQAERTAVACWDRLVELAEETGSEPSVRLAMRRMAEDEARHARVFAAMGAALDERDAPVDAGAADRLLDELRDVGDDFVPREHRSARAASPLGSGGPVVVASRGAGRAPLDLVRRACRDAGLDDAIALREAELGRPRGEMRAIVRPSFMFCGDSRDRSTYTDPALVAALVAVLRELGVTDVALTEAPNIYDRFYAGRSVAEVAEHAGFAALGLPVIDAAADRVAHAFARGLGQGSVARRWRDADLRIVFGKLKSHPVEMVFGTLGALQSLGSRVEDFLFPERMASREAALMAVLDAFPPHFALLDAVDAAADGVAGILGCPRPKAPGRLYAARDALALDMTVARHAGCPDPLAASCVRAARDWFGDPRGRAEIIGDDSPIPGWSGPRDGEWRSLMSLVAYPAYSHGPGRGSLFVARMDEAAFPPKDPSRALRLARRAVQSLLGLT